MSKSLQVSIAWNISIVILLTMAISVATTIDVVISFFISSISWTLLLFFTPLFDMWFIKPRANIAVVLANSLKRDNAQTKMDMSALTNEQVQMLTNTRPNKTMRVVYGPTFDGKLPWEEIVNGRLISLLRSIKLEGTLEVITYDDVKCTIKWVMYLMVIRSDESLIILVQHTESMITGTFRARCEAFLQSTIRTMTVEKLFAEIYVDDESGVTQTKGVYELRNQFSGLFGGENNLHPIEIKMAMQTRDPMVSEIILDPKYQKTIQAAAIAKKAAEAIKQYALTADVSPDIAANIMSLDRDVETPATVTRLIITGAEGAHIVVGDISGNKKK